MSRHIYTGYDVETLGSLFALNTFNFQLARQRPTGNFIAIKKEITYVDCKRDDRIRAQNGT
jgi:hypothetical protein